MKDRNTKDKSRSYEQNNMNKNEGTKECMSFTSSCMFTTVQTQSITKQKCKKHHNTTTKQTRMRTIKKH